MHASNDSSRALAHLAQRDLQAGRRFAAHQRGGRLGEFSARSCISLSRTASTRFAAKQRSITSRCAPTSSTRLPAGFANDGKVASTGTVPQSPSIRSPASGRTRRNASPARRQAIAGRTPIAGQAAIGAGFARHARQEPRRADVGEKPDADFRHGELITLAGHPMRSVDRNADAAAHHDAVDQRNVRLRIMLDQRIEMDTHRARTQHLLLLAGAAEFPQRANIAAGRKRLARPPPSRSRARPPSSCCPGAQLAVECTHHAVRHGIERLRPVERDNAGRAAPLEQDFSLLVHSVRSTLPI